ncbi:MAG TPA: hypothetical protein VH877_18920 [Polyangia bacterium]|jgi:hypothetical protein|nr:hypothetical protein [Polyangia bacterium]
MSIRTQTLSGMATLTLMSWVLGYGAPSWAQQPPGTKPTSTQQVYPPPSQEYPPPSQQAYPPPPPPGNQQAYPPPQGYPPPYPQYTPPPPPSYPPPYAQPRVPVRYELRPRWGLIAGGISMLGSSYLITALVGVGVSVGSCATDPASINCRTGLWPLYVPVIGPFIETAYVQGNPAAVAAGRAFLVIDGFIQAGGLTMIVLGAKLKRQFPVYSERLQLTPYATYTGGGLVARGRF